MKFKFEFDRSASKIETDFTKSFSTISRILSVVSWRKIICSQCFFSRIVESKSWCLSKHCALEIKFEMSDRCLKITTKGQKSIHDYDDENRIRFELTKNEFTEECICEFCCVKFQNDDELNQHHKLLNETLYQCPQCGIETKSFQARNSHFLSQHTIHCPYQGYIDFTSENEKYLEILQRR